MKNTNVEKKFIHFSAVPSLHSTIYFVRGILKSYTYFQHQQRDEQSTRQKHVKTVNGLMAVKSEVECAELRVDKRASCFDVNDARLMSNKNALRQINLPGCE